MQPRLTDQALVAVSLARAAALASDRHATVADLLAALAAEGEGEAGRRLRNRSSAAAALAERAVSVPAPLLDTAVRNAVQQSGARAATTVDLLQAAVAVGEDDIADLLAGAGYDRDLDGYLAEDLFGELGGAGETYGLAPAGAPDLSEPAARAMAQVRAIAGGAVALLLAVAAAPDGDGASLLPDPEALALAWSRLGGRGRGDEAGWDVGLDVVVATAAQLRNGERTTTRDLVRACLVAGGDGPKAVVEEADRA
ncbi:MAG: hypothetical protein M3415_03395 [Actinomycetota bacterium]|jgi:hypothetical protein|nr:hypothetical protein [Actinomycetota bacterium]